MFCTILRQVAWPALFIFIIMACMHLTQDHWVDSTLALPWERRSASEQEFHGVRLCAYTYITPIAQIFYLVSIGQRHVPLQLMVWWPWLLPVSCFAARFCHCTSVVVSVRDTTKPAYHSRILDRTLRGCDQKHACLWRRAVAFSYLLLLRSTCHDPSFMSHYPSPFCEPATTHPTYWPSFALTGSHWQIRPWHRHMLSIGPISWMWMRYIFGSQGMIWWWILHWASKSSTEQSSRNVIYLLPLALHMLPA